MEIQIPRLSKLATCTMSPVLVEGCFFGYCLEDRVRPKGVKIKGETAIPAGRYEVTVTMSNRFKRMMPLFVDVDGFSGVRIHGGNTSADTEGCLLIAKNRTGSTTIQGSLEAEITNRIVSASKKNEKTYVTIYDCVA